MSIWGSLILFGLFIVIYVMIVEVFTVLFRLTGLTEEKAKMQVISMLTNCGFTTGESEVIVSSKRRRKLTRITILFGYSFNVIIVSIIVNVFLAMNSAEIVHVASAGIVVGIMLVLVFLLMRIPWFKCAFDCLIERLGNHLMFGKGSNMLVLLDVYGNMAMVEVELTRVPAFLEGVRLLDSRLKEKRKIQVIIVKRGGRTYDSVGGDMILEKGDRAVLFGDYKNIRRIFEHPEE